MNRIVKCPTCNTDVVWSSEAKWRPFCSERCRLIDLGEWASENHRIAGQETLPEEQLDPSKKEDY